MLEYSKILLLFVTVLSVLSVINKVTSQSPKTITPLFQWKQIDFYFPDRAARAEAIDKKIFIPGNAVPVDVDVYYAANGRPKIFVTTPRLKDGIPITLGTISKYSNSNGRLILPYPDYEWHKSQGKDCDKMTSVFRVSIDECGRLWMVDDGKINGCQLCPPQILIFDLSTNSLIRRYKFPKNLYQPGQSQFITSVVRTIGDCANAMMYIADVKGYAVFVYDYKRNVAWKTQNQYYRPNPENSTITVKGTSFNQLAGVIGMALSRPSSKLISASNGASNRNLFFHSLAAVGENRVALSVLDNQEAWKKNPDFSPESFVNIGSRKSQSSAQAMDSNGNLFFGLMDPIAIACWDSSKPYTSQHMRLVAQNDETLQFATGIKVVTDRRKQEELWVLTNRYQQWKNGSINQNEINFYIFGDKISSLLPMSQCKPSGVMDTLTSHSCS